MVAGAIIGIWIALPLPADVADPAVVPSLVLLDRHGVPLRATRSDNGLRGGRVAFDRIDPEIIHAFVAVEDRRFFEHRGIDARAVLRAARDNLRSRRVVSGASTLTMQAARLLRPASRTWFGKVKQTLWALRLEAHLEKGRILEAYLNRVPLGQGTVGVEAAARLYFGASAEDVSLGQAALLAGLANYPARLNPIASPERAKQRRDAVLLSMHALGFATAQDVDRATREPVLSADHAARFAAPHFTTRVLLGLDGDATGELRTTLDIDLQRAVEAEVRHVVQSLSGRTARHAAAVVLDNRTGDVLAWVGSPDFFADSTGQVDMVRSRRQPGSTLKPFLYGLALDNGYSAATVLPDVPQTYATSTGPYRPQNYDRRFHGPVRVRDALASSFNVPAVELTNRLGAAALLNVLREAGFESLDRSPDHYGLGLSLGNGEVTLLELANAYRGLASGGVWSPVRLVDAAMPASADRPDTASRRAPDLRRFLSPGAAALILDILSDPVARMAGFGESSPLDLPFRAATKTGTSRHFTDNWAVAAAGNFTIAVWVGNFSGQPMQGVSGVTGAGPLLYRVALETARRYPPGWFPTPESLGASPLAVCALSGLRASPDCPSLVEWFLPGTEPAKVDDWQVAGRTHYPPEYAEWLAMSEHRPALAGVGEDDTGRAGDPPAHAGAGEGRPRIVAPRDGDRFELPPGVDARYATIPLAATPGDGVSWRIDGRPFAGARWTPQPGTHVITAEWPAGATHSVTVVVLPVPGPGQQVRRSAG
jgi:penicillin-binding protein 1C